MIIQREIIVSCYWFSVWWLIPYFPLYLAAAGIPTFPVHTGHGRWWSGNFPGCQIYPQTFLLPDSNQSSPLYWTHAPPTRIYSNWESKLTSPPTWCYLCVQYYLCASHSVYFKLSCQFLQSLHFLLLCSFTAIPDQFTNTNYEYTPSLTLISYPQVHISSLFYLHIIPSYKALSELVPPQQTGDQYLSSWFSPSYQYIRPPFGTYDPPPHRPSCWEA